jgi:predicted DNA-binding transcriptional regulator AlpA
MDISIVSPATLTEAFEYERAVQAFDVEQFCRCHNISRALLYKLWKEGKGPRIMKLGRRTLISREACVEWRARMERVTADAERGKDGPGAGDSVAWEATDSGVYPITNPPCPRCGSKNIPISPPFNSKPRNQQGTEPFSAETNPKPKAWQVSSEHQPKPVPDEAGQGRA